MTTLVTGATGLIGSRLVSALLARGDRVLAVSRRPGKSENHLTHLVADPTKRGPWLDSIKEADAVVHLAGAGVFDHRWSKAYRRVIRDSRVDSTVVLARALAGHPRQANGLPKTFLSGSAIGYYGNREEECDESAPPGDDFLANVCVDWEAAADPARAARVRVVHPRVSVVLDPAGGALPRLLRPFRLFLGGPIASGRQWMSWAHRDDMTEMLIHLLDTPNLEGPVNTASPGAVRNGELCRTIGKVLHRPSWLRAPRLAVRLAIGKAVEAVAGGQNAVPRKLQRSGFTWRYPDLEAALVHLLGESSGR